MAENTFLSGLRHEAVSHVGDQFEDQLFVDFTGAAHDIGAAANADYNLTSGDTFKAFNIPVGGVVTEIGWVTHVTDGANPQFKMDLVDTTGGTTALKTAAAVGANYATLITQITGAEKAVASGAHVLITSSVADCDDAKVTFFVKGFHIKQAS